MKRGITLLILLALLISPLILAAGEDETTLPTENSQEQIKEQLSALKGGLNEQTENVLEREIEIPKFLQFPLKIIFGTKDVYAITIERLIVLSAVWIIFFVLIKEILKLTPIFNEGWQNIIGPIIITILIAITGMIDKIVIFYSSLGNTFEWLEALGPFKIIVAIAIAMLIFFIGHSTLKVLGVKLKLEKAEVSKENIKHLTSMAKVTRDAMRKK